MYGPRTLLDAVYDAGRKGITMQRYKGLGEMNPEQLWETTLNKDVRTLLQVKIGELGEADEIFSRLMGDVVEPRRLFIQENALDGRQPGRVMSAGGVGRNWRRPYCAAYCGDRRNTLRHCALRFHAPQFYDEIVSAWRDHFGH